MLGVEYDVSRICIYCVCSDRACNVCEYGYFDLDQFNPLGCDPCQCDPLGSNDQYCNPTGGQCQCKATTQGQFCNECKDGFYDFDNGCLDCGCDSRGMEPGSFCDTATGQCICKKNVMGLKCEVCKDGFYDLVQGLIIGCKSCGCDTAGIVAGSVVCDKSSGECECKENVQGRTCNQCKPNTFELSIDNEEGCEDCSCDASGTLNGDQVAPFSLTCEQNTGQCTCLTNRKGRKCDTCEDGMYSQVIHLYLMLCSYDACL